MDFLSQKSCTQTEHVGNLSYLEFFGKENNQNLSRLLTSGITDVEFNCEAGEIQNIFSMFPSKGFFDVLY